MVYKALQISLQRSVAVKVMRKDRFANDTDRARFKRECELLANLDHANFVKIYTPGDSEIGPFFAMELVEDGSLKKKLDAGWLPTHEQAAEIVRSLADAMAVVHAQGIVHRDLKPGNILCKQEAGAPLGSKFVPKIVDFGLAKNLNATRSRTRPGAIVGTLSYMAPEQARGEPVDFACDIYGLGAVMYELLTGRPPFVGTSEPDILQKVREEDPLPVRLLKPDVPPELEAICLVCLQKDPKRRYASAKDLAADLDRFLAAKKDDPVQAQLPSGFSETIWRIILRQQFTAGTRAWGLALLLAGCLNGVFYPLAGLWIILEASQSVATCTYLAHTLAVVLAFWGALRNRRLDSGDRKGIAFIVAILIGSLLVPILHRPIDGMSMTAYRLSLYPLIALVHGLICFVQGPIFWGYYYVIAMLYFLTAVIMLLVPAGSAFIFGGMTASVLIAVGIYLMRTGARDES